MTDERPHTDDELLELLLRYVDGALSDDEERTVVALLETDARACELLAEVGWHALVLAERPGGEEPSRPATTPEATRVEPSGRSSFPGTVAVCVGIVAVASVLVWTTWSPLPTEVEPPVVRLASVSGEVRMTRDGGEAEPVASGTRVPSGSTLQTRGASLAVLEFDDVGRIAVAGDSQVSVAVDEAARVSVFSGAVRATVTPGGRRPFTLQTKLARVEFLGTDLVLAAGPDVTELEVSRGRVRVTSAADGSSRVVAEGKRAVARAGSSDLEVADVAPRRDTWSEGFENGLPAAWKAGRAVDRDLVEGSRGGIGDERTGERTRGLGVDDWFGGLYRVSKTSHVHFVYRMDRPGWMNLFLLTRTDDPHDADVTLHRFNGLASPRPGEWSEAVVPVSVFVGKRDGEFRGPPPDVGSLCFSMAWSWSDGERGLVVDRVWVTPDGPGRAEVKPYAPANDGNDP